MSHRDGYLRKMAEIHRAVMRSFPWWRIMQSFGAVTPPVIPQEDTP